MNNIWEVTSVADIVKILKSNPNKFIILGFSLVTAKESEHKLIKKFLKSKAKVYPNMLFIFFKVDKKDMGKISLLSSDATQYPWIYHIINEQIYIKVNAATEETITESFQVGENNIYKKYLETFLNEKNANSTGNSNGNSTGNANETKEDTNNNENKHELDQEAWNYQQKMIEKMINLKNKAKKYNLELLEDIKQRKKEEAKIKKENK
jgi:hypothetical protein